MVCPSWLFAPPDGVGQRRGPFQDNPENRDRLRIYQPVEDAVVATNPKLPRRLRQFPKRLPQGLSVARLDVRLVAKLSFDRFHDDPALERTHSGELRLRFLVPGNLVWRHARFSAAGSSGC